MNSRKLIMVLIIVCYFIIIINLFKNVKRLTINNSVHLSAVWENTALVQWMRFEPLG